MSLPHVLQPLEATGFIGGRPAATAFSMATATWLVGVDPPSWEAPVLGLGNLRALSASSQSHMARLTRCSYVTQWGIYFSSFSGYTGPDGWKTPLHDWGFSALPWRWPSNPRKIGAKMASKCQASVRMMATSVWLGHEMMKTVEIVLSLFRSPRASLEKGQKTSTGCNPLIGVLHVLRQKPSSWAVCFLWGGAGWCFEELPESLCTVALEGSQCRSCRRHEFWWLGPGELQEFIPKQFQTNKR